ncbi:aldehyde dehydrogenase family protein, partial [Salmonella enterica subsp. enterica serovar Istanbul]|nr:aldehyde dehydrogenase family protein [Salmonella enterica subsp. enterica serovar Istanbul]
MTQAATTLDRAPATRPKIEQFDNHIDGQWVASRTGERFDNVNPADTLDIVGRFPASSAADADDAVKAATAAFTGWRQTPISTRAKILNRAADHLEASAKQIAQELTREEGKPLNQSEDEVLR